MKKKLNTKEYPTFKTCCMVCNKSLTIFQFTVHAGLFSFALCPKHYQELLKKYKLD